MSDETSRPNAAAPTEPGAAALPSRHAPDVATEPLSSEAPIRLNPGLGPDVAAEHLAEVSSAHHRPDPEYISHYRILERIGEGGMGIVYRAEQRQPVRRIVALKVIKGGMDSKEVLARFEAERQALAMMNHPNVAKVFETGMAEDDRPFFAMEHVPGVALTRYCDDNRLTTRQRLELFVPVCHAVQHAHQKGVIHRDLKPGNILVTLFDGNPVPKVIDFGIAKATNAALTDLTLFTQLGSMIGTVEYMSPEQAQTSGLDVDTRTDVYSLGVILYELLTGALPFDPAALRRAGLAAVAQFLRETDPPRPSTRLGGSASGSTNDETSGIAEMARRRRTDVHTLRKEVCGDLDWIVLKAMEKDRTRRYETANGLAMDVLRHLSDEPVLARPPNTTYRLAKFARRYRGTVVAAAAVAATLVLGLVGTSYGLLRARTERDNAVSAGRAEREHRQAAEQQRTLAEAHQAKAQAQAVRAEAVSAYLQLMLDQFQPGSGRLPVQELSAAAAGLERDGVLRDDPETAAAIHFATARCYMMLDRPGDAVAQYQAAIHYRRLARGDDDLAMARMMSVLAAVLRANGDHGQASEIAQSLMELLHRRGIELLPREADRAPGSEGLFLTIHLAEQREAVRVRPTDAGARNECAYTALRLGRLEEAAEQFAVGARLDPGEVEPVFFSAALHLYLGDVATYERDCRALVERFGSSADGGTLDLVAKACLLRPDCPVKLATVHGIVQEIDRINRKKGSLNNFWHQLLSGMADYRAGRFDSAIRSTSSMRPQTLTGGLVAAMSQYRLDHREEALTALRRVLASDEQIVPHAGKDVIYKNPENWLVYQILFREAKQLILADEPGLPTSQPAQQCTPPDSHGDGLGGHG